MSTKFLAERVVPLELAAAVMNLAPANPFCTLPYAEARRAYGHQAWLLGIKQGGKLIAGCYGFIASGRLNSVLEIRSLPDLRWDEVFWEGLVRFCYAHRISYLQLDTRGSPGVRIPPLPEEVEREIQCDYVVNLGNPDWEQNVTKHHRRRIEMALQSGMTLCRTSGGDACRQHVRLLGASMERRCMRGESASVPGGVEEQRSYSLLLAEKGAGELFQAVVGSEVLSSIMVVKAAEHAHTETVGTSPEGMKCGASHFLYYSVFQALRRESIQTYNLGTADPDTGLSLFKIRFGATPKPLEFARFYFGSDLHRKLTNAVHSFRRIFTGR
jgi:lipid II:glycine glycyltransferase (peptidoglycan interpeptide bridge formation enzyme)